MWRSWCGQIATIAIRSQGLHLLSSTLRLLVPLLTSSEGACAVASSSLHLSPFCSLSRTFSLLLVLLFILVLDLFQLAPRGIYTSGKGASAVGLTASISRDPDTKVQDEERERQMEEAKKRKRPKMERKVHGRLREDSGERAREASLPSPHESPTARVKSGGLWIDGGTLSWLEEGKREMEAGRKAQGGRHRRRERKGTIDSAVSLPAYISRDPDTKVLPRTRAERTTEPGGMWEALLLCQLECFSNSVALTVSHLPQVFRLLIPECREAVNAVLSRSLRTPFEAPIENPMAARVWISRRPRRLLCSSHAS